MLRKRTSSTVVANRNTSMGAKKDLIPPAVASKRDSRNSTNAVTGQAMLRMGALYILFLA